MKTSSDARPRRRRNLALAATCALSLFVSIAWAQSDAYLAGLPNADRVLREIKGSDDFDTAARQASAFYTLRMTTEDLTEGRMFQRALTPGESARLAEYRQGLSAIQQRMAASFDPACQGPDCPRFRFNRLRMGYETSDAFKKSMWEALTAREWRERHVKNWHAIAAASTSTSIPSAPAATPAPPAPVTPTPVATAQGSSSSRPEMSVFGLVLDQPLTLPRCPPIKPGSAERFCWMPRDQGLLGLLTSLNGVDASMNVFIWIPTDRHPSWLNFAQVFASVDAHGVLRALEMATINDEQAVAGLLSEKYGRPSKVTPMLWRNDLGARIDFHDYEWRERGSPSVHFRSNDGYERGRLVIKAPSLATRETQQQEQHKKRELKL